MDELRQAGYQKAAVCRTCHQQIYNEWRLSSHAYASISPMFHKFEQKINDLAQGTVGTFCLRCHSSVGTTLGEPRELPLWERFDVAREGAASVTLGGNGIAIETVAAMRGKRPWSVRGNGP